MSSTTVEVKIGYLYQDGETKVYTIPEVDVENLGDVKSRVIALNQIFNGGTGDTTVTDYATNMRKTFVSSTGATLERISKAEIVITEEEEVYSYGNG